MADKVGQGQARNVLQYVRLPYCLESNPSPEGWDPLQIGGSDPYVDVRLWPSQEEDDLERYMDITA